MSVVNFAVAHGFRRHRSMKADSYNSIATDAVSLPLPA